MKIIRWFVNTFAIGGLVITSIFSGLATIVIILSIVFNFTPYYTFKDGEGFGLGGYEKGGIPINVDFSTDIPDTSIFSRMENGSSLSYRNYTSPTEQTDQNAIIYSDTIITKFDTHYGSSNNLKILGASIETGRVYVYPSNSLQKLILSIPTILKLSILSYCCWQLAMLFSFINSGNSFQPINYKSLRKAGWAIVILYLSLVVYNLLFNYSSNIWVDWSATIGNYRKPFELSFQENVLISPVWLVSGCMFIILSLAFEKGNKLQQEQDLTV